MVKNIYQLEYAFCIVSSLLDSDTEAPCFPG
jgi:hypothetical protein